jgi:hypothetical protein
LRIKTVVDTASLVPRLAHSINQIALTLIAAGAVSCALRNAIQRGTNH